MIRLHLTRGDNPAVVSLQLPATPADIGEAYAQLNTISTGRPPEIKDVESPIRNIGQYLRNAKPDNPQDMDKLNTLAQRIFKMSAEQRQLFMGTLDCSCISGLEDVLRVSEQTDEYILIPNANSDAELGRYIAVSSQFNADPRFPEASWPYLDFAKIGAEYYANHDGVYIHEGYVLRRDSGLQRQAPEPSRDGKELISLTLQGPKGKHRVLLPGDEEYLDKICDCMGVENFAETTIQEVKFHIPHATELIPTELVCVEDANELAFCIEGMQREDGELLKYLSVLSVCHPETMREALSLALDLDGYEQVPDDVEEYGKAVLRRLGADDEIIDAIDGYMDFAAMGEAYLAEDGVRRTGFGMVRRLSAPFPEETSEIQIGGM